jgi:hypothetical protein
MYRVHDSEEEQKRRWNCELYTALSDEPVLVKCTKTDGMSYQGMII